MKKNLFIIASIVMSSIGFSACTLHEEPEPTPDGEIGVDPTQVILNAELSLNLELPGTEQTIFEVPDTVVRRFVIEAYNRDREVVNRQVVYDDKINGNTFSIPVTMRLHASVYRIVVWSDYVRKSAPEAQLHHDASTLSPVINNGGYRGNSNTKDCFTGFVDLDLLKYASDWNARVDVDIELRRPMGRYQLISTDVQAFMRRLAEGSVKGTKFTARVKYAGYLDVGFNCYDQIRKHSLNYMAYNTSLRIPADDPTITIGFDYIFISPDETLDVPVEIEIVNENNETVSRSTVNVSMKRNMNTVIRGRFLTSTADGGLNIDPGYDGDLSVDFGTLTPDK